MRATLRIMWLILSLGFLCHVSIEMTTLMTNAAATTATSATTASTTKGEKTTSLTKVTPVPPTALSVNAIQESTTTHITPTVTNTQTELTTVKQTVTKSSPENMTSNYSSTKVTSSTFAAIITSSQSMATTVMPSSSSTIIPVTAVPPTVSVTVPSQNFANAATSVADAMHAIQTFKAPATTVTPMTNQENNQKGSTESSESTTKQSAVTTVVTMITAVPSTSLSKMIQASTTKTPDFPKEIFTVTNITTTTITTTIAPTTSLQLRVFFFSHKIKEESTDKTLEEVCKKLMVNFADGNCTLKYYKHHNGTLKINSVETNGKVNASIAQQYYEEITTKPKDNKTLIAILASCVALLIMIVILGACASHHRKPYNENQQHLTEELQTVENGYHDNPTLEVMEVQSEMQEKKMVLNGEFNDSWIVPFDNLLKEDIPDEEDTHL